MDQLRDHLQRIFPQAVGVNAGNLSELGDDRGAYALLIHLEKNVPFARKGLGSAQFTGELVYAGSANGPGGLQARLTRHFRRDKALRWHVDELTIRATNVEALAIAGGHECEIVEQLLASGLFEPAMPGFGSSDCTTCMAHLLRPSPAMQQNQRGGHHQA